LYLWAEQQSPDLLDDRFQWLDVVDADTPAGSAFWWVISDNAEEPRRVLSSQLAANNRDVAIGVACRVTQLRDAIAAHDRSRSVHTFLAALPGHRQAVERVWIRPSLRRAARQCMFGRLPPAHGAAVSACDVRHGQFQTQVH
jgi:hypothetical protein